MAFRFLLTSASGRSKIPLDSGCAVELGRSKETHIKAPKCSRKQVCILAKRESVY
jgi:hypothetical protein